MGSKAVPVPGFPGYTVDREGNVHRIRVHQGGYTTRRALKHSGGRVHLYNGKAGTHKTFLVHRLIALAFGLELPVCKVRTGAGEDNPRATLTWGQVRAIRAVGPDSREAYAAFALAFGTTWTVVRDIMHGKTWKHDPESV